MDEHSNFTFDTDNNTSDYDDEGTYTGCDSQHPEHCDSSDYDYKFTIDGIFLLTVAIFGIIGTLMSIAVLFKPQLQNPFTKLLTVLCMFDCTFLIMAILYISLPATSCW